MSSIANSRDGGAQTIYARARAHARMQLMLTVSDDPDIVPGPAGA